jgi:hypothetical protein
MSSPEPVDRNALTERLFALDEPQNRPLFSVPWAEDEQSGRIVIYDPDPGLYRPRRGRPRRMDPSAPVRKRKPSCPKSLRDAVYERDGWICQLCACQVIRAEASIDQILPRALGGSYVEDNVQLACQPCNERKADQLVPRFAYAPRERLRELGIIPE